MQGQVSKTTNLRKSINSSLDIHAKSSNRFRLSPTNREEDFVYNGTSNLKTSTTHFFFSTPTDKTHLRLSTSSGDWGFSMATKLDCRGRCACRRCALLLPTAVIMSELITKLVSLATGDTESHELIRNHTNWNARNINSNVGPVVMRPLLKYRGH